MYIKVQISGNRVLLANPNCPIQLLYNYIQEAFVEAYNSAIRATNSTVSDSTSEVTPKPSIVKSQESKVEANTSAHTPQGSKPIIISNSNHSVQPLDGSKSITPSSNQSIKTLLTLQNFSNSDQSVQPVSKSKSAHASKQSLKTPQEFAQGLEASKSFPAPNQSTKTSQQSTQSSMSVHSKQKSTLSNKISSKSKSKTSAGSMQESIASVTPQAKRELPENQEFDLCDDTGKLKQIYNLEPSANGWEAGVFMVRATYIVVIFERDENGAMTKPVPLIPRSYPRYSEICLKVRRQSFANTLKPSSMVEK